VFVTEVPGTSKRDRVAVVSVIYIAMSEVIKEMKEWFSLVALDNTIAVAKALQHIDQCQDGRPHIDGVVQAGDGS
jgi:hypothetical protein